MISSFITTLRKPNANTFGRLVLGGGVAGAAATSSTQASSVGTSPMISDITLKRVSSEAGSLGNPIKASTLFPPNGAIVFVVRRPGCQLCREEALDLSTQLLPKLKSPKPRLVAVVSETTSVDGFLDCFKGGETYLDEERGFSKYLGDRWLGLLGLFYPSVWKNDARGKEKYPELKGDMKGEGRRLGGLLIVDKEGQIKYEYKEEVFGDHAPMEEVEKAIAIL